MSGFWTCHECGAEMYGFKNCQFCGAHKGGGEAMSDTFQCYQEIDLRKIVDEQARKLQRIVDDATLDKMAGVLADFGYVKIGSKSRWAELFGTPERAARTLECSCHLLYGLKVDGFVACIGCPVYDKNADVDDCCYDALLEWLRGEGEANEA